MARVDIMRLIEAAMRRRMLMRGARSRFVHGRDGRVHALEVEGSGELPTLILVHGFSAAAATQYGSLIHKYLRPHFRRIVALDLPGHGLSDIPESERAGSALARSVRDVDAALHGEPAIVFATSLGGAVALRYAVSHPQRVHKLILCSPGGAPFVDREREEVLEMFRVGSHRKALDFVDRLFERPHPMRHIYAFGIARQFNRKHLKEMLAELSKDDFISPEELRGLSMPLLLLWGEAERVLPASHHDYFAEHLPPHAVIERPAGYGHAPFLDKPADVAARIVRFARGDHDAL